MVIKMVKTWGAYKKGTHFNGRVIGLHSASNWNFHNDDNGEHLIGVPQCAFQLQNVEFDPPTMRNYVEADNFLAYEWDQTEKKDEDLRELFKKKVVGNSTAELAYVLCSPSANQH